MIEDRLLKLEAELLALRAFLRAMAESHHAPEVLRHNFERVSETMLAELLATSLEEPLLDMCRERIEGVRRYLLRLQDRARGKKPTL